MEIKDKKIQKYEENEKSIKENGYIKKKILK